MESLCHFLGLPQSFPVKYLQALKLQLGCTAGPPFSAPAADTHSEVEVASLV